MPESLTTLHSRDASEPTEAPATNNGAHQNSTMPLTSDPAWPGGPRASSLYERVVLAAIEHQARAKVHLQTIGVVPVKDPSIRPINTAQEAANKQIAEKMAAATEDANRSLSTPAFAGRGDEPTQPDQSPEQAYKEALFRLELLKRNAAQTEDEMARAGQSMRNVDAKWEKRIEDAKTNVAVSAGGAAAGPPPSPAAAPAAGGAPAGPPASMPSTPAGTSATSALLTPAPTPAGTVATGGAAASPPSPAFLAFSAAGGAAAVVENQNYTRFKDDREQLLNDRYELTTEEVIGWRHYGSKRGLMLCFTKPEEPINLGSSMAARMDDVLPGPKFPELFYRSFVKQDDARAFDKRLAAHVADSATDGRHAGHEHVLRAASTILKPRPDGVVEYARWIEWCAGWCIDSEDIRIMTEAVDAVQWFETLEASAGVTAKTSFARLIMRMDQPALQKATESQCEMWIRFTVASSICTTMAYEFARSAADPNLPQSLSDLERTQIVMRTRSMFQTIVAGWREAYFSTAL